MEGKGLKGGTIFYYPEEHVTCQYFGVAKSFVFKHVVLDPAFAFRDNASDSSQSVILFLITGKLDIRTPKCTVFLNKSEMILLSQFSTVELYAKSGASFVLCSVSPDMSLCNKFTLEQLQDIEHLKFEYTSEMAIMRIEAPLFEMLSHSICVMSDGLMCMHYQKLKREEVFLYLRAYYSKQQLAGFFSAFMGFENSFRNFILQNYRSYYNLDDLIECSNMSKSTFVRKFQAAFHESPYKWLNEKRLQAIWRDIKYSGIPFTELAEKYRFSSAAYFSTYCKKSFGKTPMQLRLES